jgi:molecular chaperone GrpE (heat shock protein)
MGGDGLRDARRLMAGFDLAADLEAERERHREDIRSLLLALLAVADSLEQSLPGGGDRTPAAWGRVVALLAGQLGDVLAARGVAPVEVALGEEPQCGRDEVVLLRISTDAQKKRIVEELQRGYTWDGEVLRKSRVIVGAGVAQGREE